MTKLDGTWNLHAKVGHNKGTATFEFVEARDGSLSGTYTGMVGCADLTGTVRGESVEFSFTTKKGGAAKYSGKLVGDELSGTCTYEAAGSGTFEGSRVPA